MSTKSPAEFLRALDRAATPKWSWEMNLKHDDLEVAYVLRTLLPALADVVEAVGEFAHSTNVMAEAIPDGMDIEWEPTKELAKVYNAYYRLTAAVAELEGKA